MRRVHPEASLHLGGLPLGKTARGGTLGAASTQGMSTHRDMSGPLCTGPGQRLLFAAQGSTLAWL